MKNMNYSTVGHARQQAGFTLLEVLVATVVLGTAVAALFGLLSGALRNAGRLQDPERAFMLGQTKMNELLALGAGSTTTEDELPLDETLQGHWDERFRWQAVAKHFRPASEAASYGTVLVQVMVDVYWKPADNREERKLVLESYQLRQ
ncbi:MAG: hypothetical protein A3F68_11025, partial [Acidobacteria bacterium RIFCSPLOWO2_12_FULL_54_10]